MHFIQDLFNQAGQQSSYFAVTALRCPPSWWSAGGDKEQLTGEIGIRPSNKTHGGTVLAVVPAALSCSINYKFMSLLPLLLLH